MPLWFQTVLTATAELTLALSQPQPRRPLPSRGSRECSGVLFTLTCFTDILSTAQPTDAITYCKTLDELLEKADVVSLHVPLNDKTNKFFGKEQFNKMKKGSCLVNTARGGVVDEEALLEALASGQLGSAGLDVFPNEPEINPELLKNDRVTCLPHMGEFGPLGIGSAPSSTFLPADDDLVTF